MFALVAGCTQQAADPLDPLPPPPPVLVAVELTPASASVQTGGAQQFSVLGRRSDGSTQSVTPSYTATGGTITPGGLYTAGSTVGTFRVIASASGFADTSSLTLTTPPPPPPGGSTVFAEDFESNPNLDALFQDRFGQHRVLTDAATCYQGTRCLEVTFPAGGDGGWLSHFFSPGLTSGTIRLSARIRLAPGWSGVTRIAGLKGSPEANTNAANGVAGVCADLGKNGVADDVDPMFTGVVEMAAGSGQLGFYDQWVNQNGTPPGNCWSVVGSGGGMGTATYTPAGSVTLVPGTWHLFEMELTLNTPGQPNGSHRFYLDGQLIGSFPNLTWRNRSVVELTQMQLDMHASGSSPRLQYVYWDDIRVTQTP